MGNELAVLRIYLRQKGVQKTIMKKTIIQKKRWIRKLIYGLAWSFILLTGTKIVVHGFSDADNKWWKAVSNSVTGAVLQTTAPASMYVMEEKSETLSEIVMRSVRNALPVLEYAGKKNVGNTRMQDPFYVESRYASDDTQEEAEHSTTEAECEVETVMISEIQEAGTGEETETEVFRFFSPQIVGEEYPLAKLKDYDFLIQNFYAVSEITTLTSSELDAGVLLGKDLTLSQNKEEPQILIYHSHSQEEFSDSRPGIQEDTIVGVGDYLAQLLTEQYGYCVYHDKTTYDVVNGALDRNEAYNCAAIGVEAILEKYPSIEVILDIHRDGVNENVHLVKEINGKPTAQIMFVNGISKTTMQGEISYLKNPYIEDNLAFSLMMQLKAEAYYPGFTRRIMIKAYRYNMHFRARTLLVEVGAQTNTLQEAKNAMEPLAVMLHETLSGG